MPNLEKESEADSVPAGQGLSHDEMAKLIGQRLESLRRAGLTHLPKGTGEYEFEPIQAAESQTESVKTTQPEIQSKPNTPTTGATPAAPGPQTDQPANVVKESSPGFATGSGSPAPPAIPAPATAPQPAATSTAHASPPADLGFAADAYGPSLPAEQRAAALKVLQEEVARCTRCDELASTRSQLSLIHI